jgi:hypothetical protein
MIVLYTFLTVLLSVWLFICRRRVRALEKKYVRIQKQADDLLRQPYRPGNSNRGDICESAKRHYQLALVATRRDRAEARFNRWQARAERAAKRVAALRRWKGRKLPYTFGVIDTAMLMYLIDYCGAGRLVSVRPMFEAVAQLFTR